MRIFNTVSRSVEEFEPAESNRVRMYTCGPTVYSFQHIGNLRAYMFADFLKRTLFLEGYRVLHVMNITDVGHLTDDADAGHDKVEEAARRAGTDAWTMTEKYKAKFLQDCGAVGIMPPDVACRATDHIQEQVELIRRIEAKGFAYRSEDGMYFDTAAFKPLTDLSRMQLKASDEHSRVGTEGKRSSADFALWKFSAAGQKRQMAWPSPWGVGFPGWHLECSAMSMKYLGESFDLHTGGVDHIPVHHTNEIIQSEAATGKPFVRYWVHGAWLHMGESQKMSKSKGGTVLLDDLIERGYDPLAFRYLVLTAHYRAPLKFTWEGMEAAATALNRIRSEMVKGSMRGGRESPEYMGRFRKALAADVNTPEALAVVWSLLKDASVAFEDRRATLLAMDSVLGLRLCATPVTQAFEVTAEVLALVSVRAEFKSQRRFSEADEVRGKIEALGFCVVDTPAGPALRTR